MERLIETIRPNLPPNQRRSVAEQYAMLLTVANAGAKAGVEKDPKVQEELRISRLQILASSYSRQLSQESSEVLPAEIQKHYKDNAAQYEEAKLLRIYVPMTSNAEGKPGDPAASKTLADKIRQRAAAGEDFEKLQKDAFTEANNKGTPPAIDLGERRRGTLPPKQESSIFELKPGEISPAFEESTGFYIYKLVSKETVPLDKVKDEIKNTIARERFKETMDKLRASVKPTFNEAYFGTAPTPAAMPQPAPAAPQTPASAQAPSPSPAATPAQPPSSAEAPKTNPPDTAK